LGATSAATGVNGHDKIVGNTSGTVFMYSVADDTLADLNSYDLISGDPNHVPLYMAELYGLTDANVFFGKYVDLNNQPRYFQGYVDGMLVGANPHTLAGDYNANGTTDTADYVVWRQTLGQSPSFGHYADGDADGYVNDADYEVWRSHFGQPAGPAETNSVIPEPRSSLLLLVALALALGRASRPI
jgi:hypothetical protein